MPAQTTVKPRRLRSAPLMTPRTEWGCQPVSEVICSSVPPSGLLSRAISWACLEAPSTGSGALRLGVGRFAGLARAERAVAALGRGLDRVGLVAMSISVGRRARWRRDQ